MKHVKRLFAELLMVRMIRTVVGKLRFFYYARILRNVRTQESKHAIAHTVEHNLKAIGAFGLTRMDKLKKTRFVRVVFADTGALKAEVQSPFQNPAFKAIRVMVVDTDGEGGDRVAAQPARHRHHDARIDAARQVRHHRDVGPQPPLHCFQRRPQFLRRQALQTFLRGKPLQTLFRRQPLG